MNSFAIRCACASAFWATIAGGAVWAGVQDQFAPQWWLVAQASSLNPSESSSRWIVLAGFRSQEDCENAKSYPVVSADTQGNRKIVAPPANQKCVAAADLGSTAE